MDQLLQLKSKHKRLALLNQRLVLQLKSKHKSLALLDQSGHRAPSFTLAVMKGLPYWIIKTQSTLLYSCCYERHALLILSERTTSYWASFSNIFRSFFAWKCFFTQPKRSQLCSPEWRFLNWTHVLVHLNLHTYTPHQLLIRARNRESNSKASHVKAESEDK